MMGGTTDFDNRSAFLLYGEIQMENQDITLAAVKGHFIGINRFLCCLCYLCRFQFYPVLLSEYHDLSVVPCVYNSCIIHFSVELDWAMEKTVRALSRKEVIERGCGKITHLSLGNPSSYVVDRIAYLSLNFWFHMLSRLWSFSGFGQAFLQLLNTQAPTRTKALG